MVQCSSMAVFGAELHPTSRSTNKRASLIVFPKSGKVTAYNFCEHFGSAVYREAILEIERVGQPAIAQLGRQ